MVNISDRKDPWSDIVKTPNTTILSGEFASEDLFCRASDLIKIAEEANVTRKARGDIAIQEHNEAYLVAKRAVLTGIVIGHATDFLMGTNPVELRTQLQQVFKKTRHELSTGRST